MRYNPLGISVASFSFVDDLFAAEKRRVPGIRRRVSQGVAELSWVLVPGSQADVKAHDSFLLSR